MMPFSLRRILVLALVASPAEAPPAHATVAEPHVPPPVRARETVRISRAASETLG